MKAPRGSTFAKVAAAALVALTMARSGEAETPADGAGRLAGVTVPAAGASELERLLARLDAEEKALQTEVTSGASDLAIVRQRIILRGRAYYKLVHAGLLPAGGGFEALVDHAAKVERTRLALERDLAHEKQLLQRGVEISERLTRLRAEREPLAIQREAMTRARAALEQADERRAAFARAFESSERPDHVAIYGADLGPSDVDARAGFRAQRGRLLLPVAGRAEVRKVTRAAGVQGVEFAASLGTPVRSVAAGRVVFADRYDDYGLTVLLDHGDHYYSLYGSLASADVRVGEVVAPGGRIGTIGSEGGNPAALRFEIRKNADSLDAGAWLGL